MLIFIKLYFSFCIMAIAIVGAMARGIVPVGQSGRANYNPIYAEYTPGVNYIQPQAELLQSPAFVYVKSIPSYNNEGRLFGHFHHRNSNAGADGVKVVYLVSPQANQTIVNNNTLINTPAAADAGAAAGDGTRANLPIYRRVLVQPSYNTGSGYLSRGDESGTSNEFVEDYLVPVGSNIPLRYISNAGQRYQPYLSNSQALPYAIPIGPQLYQQRQQQLQQQQQQKFEQQLSQFRPQSPKVQLLYAPFPQPLQSANFNNDKPKPNRIGLRNRIRNLTRNKKVKQNIEPDVNYDDADVSDGDADNNESNDNFEIVV